MSNNEYGVPALLRNFGHLIPIFVILFSLFAFAPSAQAAWYDSSYDYCRELTMTDGGTSGGVATTTTKGFALVATSTITTLKTTGNGGNITQTSTASGTTTPVDVIITNGTECNSDGGSTVLDFYFEKYVAATGEFVLWVEPTDISSTTEKTVLIYYGNSGASDQSDEEGTFSASGEVGVWNFHEDPSGSAPQMLDSTSNNNDGTSNGSMTSSDHVRGMADGALQFEYDDYISRTHTASLALSVFTMSFWIKTNEFNDGTQTFMVQKYDYPNSGFVIGDHGPFSQNVYFDWFNGSAGHTSFARSLVNDDNWHLITAKYNGSIGYLYLDGTLRSTDTHALTTDTTEPLNLGFQNGPNNDDNVMDDVRIYSRALHAMDILTIYNNTRSSTIFWTFGSEETEITAPSVTTNSATGITSTDATLNGNITGTGGQTGAGTQHGFAYSTDATLTTGVSTSTLGNYSGTGAYSESISSLTRGTKYYFRAYVTNTNGTAYGSIQSFKTFSALLRPANNLGLVGYWPMNEATSTQAGDFSGRGNHGTLSPGEQTQYPTWTNGIRGGALDFQGDYPVVDIPSSSSLGVEDTFTVSAWIKRSTFGTEQVVWGLGDFHAVGAFNTTNALRLCGASLGCSEDSTIAITDSNWHHIVITKNGATTKYYIDNVDRTPSITNVDMTSGAAPFYIGADASNGGYSFDGKIDEVRVYSRPLSATEIAYLYNGGAARLIASSKTLTQGTTLGPSNGLVGHWSFDGGDMRWTSLTAGFAYDGSGNNNIGILTNMVRTSAAIKGKLGQALNFDGVDDYISVPHSSSLCPSNISVSLWLNYTSLTALTVEGGASTIESYILSKRADNYFDAYTFYKGSGSGGHIHFFAGGSNSNVAEDLTDIVAGQWYHFVGTYDGSRIDLYRDGVLVASDETATQASPCATSGGDTNLVVGRHHTGTGYNAWFYGKLDDTRIYNRVLSAAEVRQLYKLGAVIIR